MAFLNLPAHNPSAMNARTGRKFSAIIIGLLLVAWMSSPIGVLGQTGSPSQVQLATLVGVAEASQGYANSTVEYALLHGLGVSVARAELAQGDSLLAAARADVMSGTDTAAGIQSAQAAMRAFTSAASSASLALANAGLVAAMDYNGVSSTLAEVNATTVFMAKVASQACGSNGISELALSNRSAFAQACSALFGQVMAAREDLSEASLDLAAVHGQAGAGTNFTQALALVAQARTSIGASQAAVLVISSFNYTQRAQAFLTNVVVPLSTSANLTIAAEQNTIGVMGGLSYNFATYASSQAANASSVTSLASTLGGAIVEVDTSAVQSGVSTAQAIATSTQQDLTNISSLIAPFTSIGAVAALQSSISSAESAAGSYSTAAGSAGGDSASYMSTPMAGFSSYLSTVESNQQQVSSAESSFTTTLTAAQAQLSTVVNLGVVPGLGSWGGTLETLSQSLASVTSDLDSSLQSEVASMSEVQAEISAFSAAVSASTPAVDLKYIDVATANAVEESGTGFLNATGSAAISQMASSVLGTYQDSANFTSSAGYCLRGTIGTFAMRSSVLSGSAASLESQTKETTAALTTASAYLSSDAQARSSDRTFGQVNVALALQSFSALDVATGATALAQACIEFQAAASSSA